MNPWQNLQKKCFLRNLHKNSQVNPQEKLKILVIAGLAPKKVGDEPGLVPRLAGGRSAPDENKYMHDTTLIPPKNLFNS
jgi:hypothetical protein